MIQTDQGSPIAEPQAELSPEALLQAGFAAYQRGALDEADRLVAAALRGNPADPAALNSYGVILRARGRLDEALAYFDRALILAPTFAEALNNRGNTLRELKRADEALASYDCAIAINPAYAAAHYNRGVLFADLRLFDEALVSYDSALAIAPDTPAMLNNRGLALNALGRLDEALASFDRVLARDPKDVFALTNRGVVLRELRRADEALESYAQALAIAPNHVQVHLNRGHIHLMTGDFARGWEGYEWRWRDEQLKGEARSFAAASWRGEKDIVGKTMLLYAEQGFGDTLQFCRYAPLVAEQYGARVVLEVQPALKRLLAAMPGVDCVIARGEPLPAFDATCPLLSLPHAFKTTLATIPPPTPHIAAPPKLVGAWAQRLGATAPPRIGIVWRGDPRHPHDSYRSIALDQLLSILNGVATCISLQRELRDDERARLANASNVLHVGDALTDFADTAAAVAAMDLVITVDTAVAHLAGTMGKKTWVLLPYIGLDWRWMTDRDDSPWYPSMRLFPQTAPRDWDGVLVRVSRALATGF